MPMTTQCRRCGRRFRVYAQGLRANRGRVECPQCGHRFDGLAALLDERQTEATNGLGEPSSAPPVAAIRTRLGLHSSGAPLAVVEARRRGASRFWGALVILLAVALGLQSIWWRRGELLRDPEARAFLDRLCDRLGCQVPAPRLPGTLSLLDPTLTPGPEAEALTLRLRIGNQADLVQVAPVLDLELYDLRGDLAAARRFSPAEYAPHLGRYLGPREAIEVNLPLIKPGEGPAGFKVRLL